MVVAVVDTGLDYTHPEIAANVWRNPGEIAGNGVDDDGNGFIDDVRGWNFVVNTNDPKDGNGHGTHVSGTIAAVGNNGIGVIGVAPQAEIMPVKALDDTGSGQGDGVDIKDGLVNVTVRGNTIQGMFTSGTAGITAEGVYSGSQNLLIEKNTVSNGKGSGIRVGNTRAAPNGVVMRNNVVYGNSEDGIKSTGSTTMPHKSLGRNSSTT